MLELHQTADPPEPSSVGSSPLTSDLLASGYAERVHRFAAMVMKNGQDSEDLAQEALIKAICSLHKYCPDKGTVEAWLWRIVLNTARDAGRASVRQATLRDRLRGIASRDDARDTVERTVLSRLRDDELLSAVRRLPVRPRTIVALRFGGGLSHFEIGEHLHMSPKAASMALSRALARLHHDLEAHK